jgi:glycosyltransferase involved in cell wall biosynthesis
MIKKNYFSLVMPVFNEAPTIEKTIKLYWKFLKKYPGAEFIIAEDGSSDGTKEILKKLKKTISFKLVSSNARKGYTKAVIDALKLSSRDFVLFSDSDGQHNPQDFTKLLQYYPEHDLIIGEKRPRKDPFYRLVLAGGYNLIINLLFGSNFRDIDSGFRLIKKKVIDSVLPKSGKFRYCYSSEFTIIARQMDFKIKEIPTTHYPRSVGESNVFSPIKLPRVCWGLFLQLLSLRRSFR